MIADVWSKRDFIAAIVVLAAVALVAIGRWLDLPWLTSVGGLGAVVGMIVFVARRAIGSFDRRRGPSNRV